jgi:hypothetical protein
MQNSPGLSSFAGFLVVFSLTGFASAQELPDAPESQPDLKPAAFIQQNKPEPTVDKGDQRILFVMPGYGVSNRQDAAPLTAKEKLVRAAKGTYDPYSWLSTGFQVGLSQAGHQFPQYGYGVAGYSKRYGAAMLDQTTGEFAGTGYCILFKEDPRYFRLGEGSIRRRLFYSLAQEFSAKSDKGTRMFKWANLLGTFTSSAISNAYYPPASRGVGLTMTRAATSFLWDFTGELPDEFWPDVKRKFFQRNTGMNRSSDAAGIPPTRSAGSPRDPALTPESPELSRKESPPATTPQ